MLHRLGTERAFVVHGAGVDELPLDGSGVIHEVDPAGVREIGRGSRPRSGSPRWPPTALAGGTPEENARLVEARPGRRARPAARRRAAQRRGRAHGGRSHGDAGRRHRAGPRDDRRRRSGAPARRACAPSAPSTSRRSPRPRRPARELRHDRRRPADPPGAPRAARPVGRRRDRRAPRGRRRGRARRGHLPRARSAGPPPRPRRGTSPAGSPGPASTSSPRSSAPRRRPARSPRRATTSSPGPGPTRPAARRRSRSCASRTGSAARSTTCAAVRAAVSVPVLAKEFVVDERQLPVLRAAGADVVLLLAVLHPARRLARLVGLARDLGLEPLVEAHDERELERALATGARLIGLNNRDLRTLDGGPGAGRPPAPARPGGPAASSPSPASASRRPSPAGGRSGFDAALVGEALVRAADPATAARAFVAAGADPTDPASRARAPFVKICGITDAAGVLAAVAAGADAIGLNLVPGTPRALSLDEAVALAGLARSRRRAPARGRASSRSPPTPRPRSSPGSSPASIRTSSSSPATSRRRPSRASPGRRGRRIHLPPSRAADERASPRGPPRRTRSSSAPGPTSPPAPASGSSSTPPAARIRAAPGVRVDGGLAAAVARELPVILAGGLDPASVGPAVLAVPAVGVDVASGVEAPRVAGQRPRKDPLRVALFVKRARAARLDRPNTPFRPTPVHPGLLEADAAGRWGRGSRVRRAVRPRDAHGRPRAARAGLRRPARRPALLGRAARAPRDVRRPADADLPRRPARRGRPGRRRGPPRRGPRDRPARRRPSGSTSSARTSPTRARTR